MGYQLHVHVYHRHISNVFDILEPKTEQRGASWSLVTIDTGLALSLVRGIDILQ